MDNGPAQTPLTDLLGSVPIDARAWYEHGATHHEHIPYGKHCHDALAEITRLTAERDALKAAQPKVGESDRECYRAIDGIYHSTGHRQDGTTESAIVDRIAAHVASRLAPIQAELDGAMGLLRTFLRFSADFCEIPPYELDDKAHRFLLRHQRDNAQSNKPEGGEQ